MGIPSDAYFILNSVARGHEKMPERGNKFFKKSFDIAF